MKALLAALNVQGKIESATDISLIDAHKVLPVRFITDPTFSDSDSESEFTSNPNLGTPSLQSLRFDGTGSAAGSVAASVAATAVSVATEELLFGDAAPESLDMQRDFHAQRKAKAKLKKMKLFKKNKEQRLRALRRASAAREIRMLRDSDFHVQSSKEYCELLHTGYEDRSQRMDAILTFLVDKNAVVSASPLDSVVKDEALTAMALGQLCLPGSTEKRVDLIGVEYNMNSDTQVVRNLTCTLKSLDVLLTNMLVLNLFPAHAKRIVSEVECAGLLSSIRFVDAATTTQASRAASGCTVMWGDSKNELDALQSRMLPLSVHYMHQEKVLLEFLGDLAANHSGIFDPSDPSDPLRPVYEMIEANIQALVLKNQEGRNHCSVLIADYVEMQATMKDAPRTTATKLLPADVMVEVLDRHTGTLDSPEWRQYATQVKNSSKQSSNKKSAAVAVEEKQANVVDQHKSSKGKGKSFDSVGNNDISTALMQYLAYCKKIDSKGFRVGEIYLQDALTNSDTSKENFMRSSLVGLIRSVMLSVCVSKKISCNGLKNSQTKQKFNKSAKDSQKYKKNGQFAHVNYTVRADT